MHFLYRIRDLFADFLFPQSAKVLELEALSAGALLQTLPPAPTVPSGPAESLKDKHTMALFDYGHPIVKEIIWELKYSGNVRIAEKLGELLYDHLRHELSDLALFESASWRMDKPILVPIPMSDKRRFERGWNQSELLAEEVLKRDSQNLFKYLPRQLVKIRDTESQTKTASRKERLENLRHSMKVLKASSVAGACVIVLDDVTTTGSTFAEARRALRAAGARKILCVAVAH